MSWDSEIVTIVRVYIGDVSSSPTYSDDQIAQTILIALMQVQQENSLDNSYRVNVDSQTIKPDPTGPNRDEACIYLVTLKTCYIIAMAELKVSGGQAIAIVDNDSSIDLRGQFAGRKEVAKQFLDAYEDARWKHALGQRPSGQGILGPVSILTPGTYGASVGYQMMDVRDRPSWR